MKTRNENPLIISSFQLLDASEKSFLKESQKDTDLSLFEFEVKRIANFYADGTICQIYWKNAETGKNSLLASIDIRETSQKNLDNAAAAFQAILRNNTDCETFLCLIRDAHDLPFEAEKIALQAKLIVVNALKSLSPDVTMSASPESILEQIKALDKKKQEFKKSITPAPKQKKEEESYVPKTKAENLANELLGKQSSNDPVNVDPNDLMKDLMGQRNIAPEETTAEESPNQEKEEPAEADSPAENSPPKEDKS